MTSAMIRLRQRREHGQKVVEVELPRRILTALRSMNPAAVRFKFGIKEQFEISARDLQEAIVETYKKKAQELSLLEKQEKDKRMREAALAAARKRKAEEDERKRKAKKPLRGTS